MSKELKWYILFGISIICFIYTFSFMPSVKYKGDHSKDLWFAGASELQGFYAGEGVINIEKILELYKGSIDKNLLETNLDLAIGSSEEFSRIYTNTPESYQQNKDEILETYGIDNYSEFEIFHKKLSKLYENGEDDVLHVTANVESCQEVSDGLVFEMLVEHNSSAQMKMKVKFYNQEQTGNVVLKMMMEE